MISIPTAVTLFVALITAIVYLDRLVTPGEELELVSSMGPAPLAAFQKALGLQSSPEDESVRLPSQAASAPPAASGTAVPAPAAAVPASGPAPARPSRASEAALRDLASAEPEKVERARLILLELSGPPETAVLIRMLKGPDTRLARRAAELLFRLGNAEILPHLADFLRQKN